MFMRAMLCVAIFAGAMLMAVHAASAEGVDDSETLAAFLTRCDAGASDCIGTLKRGFAAAVELNDACPPSGLSEDDAAQTELTWLKGAAASSPAMSNGKESDAEWNALLSLWSCGD